MGTRSRSVRLALGGILIGTASAWALAPHDKAEAPTAAKTALSSNHLNSNETDKSGEGIGERSTPQPIIVQITSPQKSEAETTEDRKETERKADVDRQMVELTAEVAQYTKWLAYATIALVVFTGGLFAYAARQGRDAKEAVRAANRSAETAVKVLEGAETPYLIPIVRKFDPERDTAPDTGEGFMSYRFRNCGRSPAIMLERYHSLGVITRTPTPMSFPPPQTNLFRNEIVGPGDKSEIWRFKPGAVRDWTPSDQTRAACLIGQVRYADVFGNQFVTNFCYLRNGWSGSWYASGVPACNARRQLTPDEMVIAQARDSMPGQAET